MGNENSRHFNFDQQRKMHSSNNSSTVNSNLTTEKHNNKVVMTNSNSLKVETSSSSYQDQNAESTSSLPNLSELDKLKVLLKSAQNDIQSKNQKIEDLQREIDKLKSVLDQTYMEVSDVDEEKDMKRPKRLGVAAESSDNRKIQDLVRVPKTQEQSQLIRSAILHNHLLGKLDQSQVTEMVQCMYKRQYKEKSCVIREGEDGEHLYVAEDGEFEVQKDNKFLGKMTKGKCFGELALLYNCKRTASVKALKPCTLWVLDRLLFQTIMLKTGLEKQNDLRSFVYSVPLFKNVPEEKLSKLAQLLEVQRFTDGQCIIREGETADSFFIIRSGYVKVTQKMSQDEEVLVRELSVREYFGEKALLEEGNRTASVYAVKGITEVLCLYREGFLDLVGDLNELQSKEYDDYSRMKSITSQTSVLSEESNIASAVQLDELQKIATLGMGGFGRVELVIAPRDPGVSYALKCMKKQYIVQTKQQNHVLQEKKILLECKNDFICKLYATYHDNKYVYLLSEVCLGGELWTILRDRVHFDDIITQFCLACVLEALQYLHNKGIVYRDLKPENLLIGNNGYLKLCDFGFAKKIGIGKRTWTFCGTPEYVAPEIILNKSHDFSADYWSIGILTFELLNGSPPFIANDPMKIYHMTLKGIEAANIHHNRRISLKAAQFIQKMCCFHAIERLGNGKNGFSDIRSNKYFTGFDWQKFQQNSLKSPLEPKINGPKDLSHFDKFSPDKEVPPDELSGWDKHF